MHAAVSTLQARKHSIASRITRLAINYDINNEVYFIGSCRKAFSGFFSDRLSDIDLLVVANCDSLAEYIAQLRFVKGIYEVINDEEILDVLFINGRITTLYFQLLPTIHGYRKLDEQDRIFSRKIENRGDDIRIGTNFKKKLYAAAARRFCLEYSRLLPEADASQARKITKEFLKGYKLLVCAHTRESELLDVESKLCGQTHFRQLADVMGIDKRSVLYLQRILDGSDVNDWSRWMVIQDSVARHLYKETERLEGKLSINEVRLYDSIFQIWDMLTKGVKDVLINGKDNSYRISVFADTTASLIVKIALCGIDTLNDSKIKSYHSESVLEAHKLLMKHLSSNDYNNADAKLLASSIVLLEHTLRECTYGV